MLQDSLDNLIVGLGVEMGVKVEGGTHEHFGRIFVLGNQEIWQCFGKALLGLGLQELGLELYLILVDLDQ